VLWGKGIARIQVLGDDTAMTLRWAVGRQAFVQIERFCHTEAP